jgi:flagellar M-ring protein FliF
MLIETLLLFAVIELIINNFIEPWLYGTSMGISSVAILLSTLFWAWLWGALGYVVKRAAAHFGCNIGQITSNETGQGSEPGMTPNQPRQIRQPAASKNTRTRETSRVSTDSVPVGVVHTTRQIAGFTPKSVQVAVSIPKDYYRDVALKDGVDAADKNALQAKIAQLKTDTEKEVREKIARLIPPPASGTAADVINVSSYTPLETVEPPTGVPLSVQATETLSQWGGPAGLVLFALWALWMLNRSLKRGPELPASAAGGKQLVGRAPLSPTGAAEDEEEESKVPTKRDKLQTLVKDNPEMAASVISRWLSPPK